LTIYWEWYLPKLESIKIIGNEWDCGCNSSFIRWGIEDPDFNSTFWKVTDQPLMNCTSPEQIAGQVLNHMDISWYPQDGNYGSYGILRYLTVYITGRCKMPTALWGTSQIFVRRKHTLELTCEIFDGNPKPRYEWVKPDGTTQKTENNTLSVENARGNESYYDS